MAAFHFFNIDNHVIFTGISAVLNPTRLTSTIRKIPEKHVKCIELWRVYVSLCFENLSYLHCCSRQIDTFTHAFQTADCNQKINFRYTFLMKPGHPLIGRVCYLCQPLPTTASLCQMVSESAVEPAYSTCSKLC